MAPMTRTFSKNGIPTDDVASYYRRRAEADVGLILSEGAAVNRPASSNHPDIPHFYGASSLNGWKEVVRQVHDAGGAMGPQLWHAGAVSNPMTAWLPNASIESPSGLLARDQVRGTAMDDSAIEQTIWAFGQAAADAKSLGFDVFELHGAHGYLIDQFFWEQTNLRTDSYGGVSLRERTRFAVEVIKAARAAVGPNFPIIMRLSQWKQQDYSTQLAKTPEEMSAWLEPLVDAGVDLFHCSQRRFWEPEFPAIDGEKGLNFAGWARKLTGVPTISVGSVGLEDDMLSSFAGKDSQPSKLDKLIERMEKNEFDLIAVGRALLADAQWASKLKEYKKNVFRGFNAASLADLH